MEYSQARLSRLQLLGTLFIVLIVAVVLSCTLLVLHWRDFNHDQQAVEQIASSHARENLKAFSEQTDIMLGTMRAQASRAVKDRLRDQVDRAWNMASVIWQREQGHLPPTSIARQIVDTLKPLGFQEGHTYFFLITPTGQNIIAPNLHQAPEVLHNLPKLARAFNTAASNPEGAGYIHYQWPFHDESEMQDKIAYVRRFQSLNWLIAAGEYIKYADQALQNNGLELLAQLQTTNGHQYIVINNSNNTLLMYPPDPYRVGQHIDSLPSEMRTAITNMLNQGRSAGFVDYQLADKHYLAYSRQMPGWGWTVADTRPIQQQFDFLRQSQNSFNKSLYQRINISVVIIVLSLGLAALFSWLFNRWLNASFTQYRNDLWSSHHELRERSRELLLTRFMMDNATEAVCLMDQHSRLAYCNEMARRLLGEAGPLWEERLAKLFNAPDTHWPQTYPIAWPADLQRILEVSQDEVLYEGERYRVVRARDISNRVKNEKALRLAAKVFETSTEAILIADHENRILTVNQAFQDSTGYSEAELIGCTPSLLASGQHSQVFYQNMWKILQKRGRWSGEIWNQRKNGEIFPEWLTISVLTDENGKVSHYVALFTDISERKRQEAQMRYLAEYDSLTKLPNRSLLHERLENAVKQAQQQSNEVAVLFIDLDNFKNINDSLGHAHGDELLKQVAQRLSQTLQRVDCLGRSGGDEFTVILPVLHSPEQATMVAERLLATLQQPFMPDGHAVHLTASIGISLYPRDGRDSKGLMMSADLALFYAKANGRNTYRLYSGDMNTQFNERLQLESRLREAIELDQLHLVYQPLFDMASMQLMGCEALLRWVHPELGSVAPERFIPVAEETGLIAPIGSLVLDRACAQIAAWQKAGLTTLPITLNIAAGQLVRTGLVDSVRATLAKYHLAGSSLMLDMNEDALMANPARTLSILDRLKASGVRLVIDNFGIGYSSPSYLKRFAPDMIKIDRAFITGLPDNEDDSAIVSAIIHLASALAIPTVAQGVENETQRQFLLRHGCSGMQGFLGSEPLTAAAMEQLLAERAKA